MSTVALELLTSSYPHAADDLGGGASVALLCAAAFLLLSFRALGSAIVPVAEMIRAMVAAGAAVMLAVAGFALLLVYVVIGR